MLQAISDKQSNILCNGIVDRYFFSIIINYDDLVSILVSIFQITMGDNHMKRLFNPLSDCQIFNIMKKMILLSILSIPLATMCDVQDQNQKDQTRFYQTKFFNKKRYKEMLDAKIRCYEHYVKGKETRHYPIHQAVEEYDIECIKVLLETRDYAKNDPNISDLWGNTALHHVLLLTIYEPMSRTFNKLDPMYRIFRKIEKELVSNIIKALIEGGVDVHATNGNGQTALHQAAHYGSEEMVKVLLKHDAGADVFTKDKQRMTPKDMLENHLIITRNKEENYAIRSMLEREERIRTEQRQQQPTFEKEKDKK